MYSIVLLGSGKLFCDIVSTLVHRGNFGIKYLIPPVPSGIKDPEFIQLADKFSIKTLSAVKDSILQSPPDLIFSFKYFNYVPISVTRSVICVNLHAGILPFWRGPNANLWAILNQEAEAGYSIHRMNERYDDGPIYRIYKKRVSDFSDYESLRLDLLHIMINDLPDLLTSIVEGNEPEISQNEQYYTYTTFMKAEDGIITNWNYPLAYYKKLFYIMGHAAGTGVYVFFSGKTYRIHEISAINEFVTPKVFCPGAVVYSDDAGYIGIAVNGGLFVVKTFMVDNAIIPANNILKIHTRL